MKIAGQLFVGEAAAWAAKASKPLSGYPWPMIWSNLIGAVIALGAIITMSALQALGVAPDWGWAVALLIAIVGGIRATMLTAQKMTVRHFKKALLTRDVPNPLSMSCEIVEGWFVTTTGVVESRAPITAISDISRIGPYWVLLIQGGAHYIPARLFASPEEERAFLLALREGVGDATRRRSPDITAALA